MHKQSSGVRGIREHSQRCLCLVIRHIGARSADPYFPLMPSKLATTPRAHEPITANAGQQQYIQQHAPPPPLYYSPTTNQPVWMLKMRRLVFASGSGNSIFLSMRPGRMSAGSSVSMRFVAMMTCACAYSWFCWGCVGVWLNGGEKAERKARASS